VGPCSAPQRSPDRREQQAVAGPDLSERASPTSTAVRAEIAEELDAQVAFVAADVRAEQDVAAALSVDLAGQGIRVNCVCPSIVDTPMARADLGAGPDGFAGSAFPVQSPDQVANHVLYLASASSGPVNGASLVSDFGYLCRSSFPA
jgi:hypothetical protein